ncbi:MAG TPA: hypothetical protein VNG51_18680 [Ktedonobacteraceae bacterium]|nr:hypothetical protein [Ktedonobacteraceae bacterium]
MVTLKSEQNRGYLVAGIGASVALFAFIYLPFASISLSAASTGSSVGGYSFSVTTREIADLQGGIWLEGILALALLVLACLLLFRTNPFGSSRMPVVNQIRNGIYGLGGGAILGILLQFIISLGLGSALQQEYLGSGAGVNTSATVSTIYGIGGWLYLLGMIAVIVGSVLAYQKSGLVPSTPGASTYQAQTPLTPSSYAAPGTSPYDTPYPAPAPQGSVPPYQQNVQPSSPYDAQGASAPLYSQDAGMSYPYQVPNPQQPQVPPQQWPPSYPSS